MGLFKRSMRQLAQSSFKKTTFRPDLETLGERVVPATTWIGPNGGNWSNPANWSAGIPDANDQVTFNTGGTSVMDLPDANAVVQGISFDSVNATTLNLVNSLRISSAFNLDALSNVGNAVNIQGPGAIVFVGGGQYGIGVANTKTVNIFADLTGSGTVTFDGNGTGSAFINGDITVSGSFTVIDGSLTLNKDGGVVTTPFAVGDGAGAADTATVIVTNDDSVTVNELTVASDGELFVNSGSKLTTLDLTLEAGTDVDGLGTIVLTGKLNATSAATPSEFTGQTRLNGNVEINAGGPAAVDLLFSGVISGTGTATVGGGTVRIGGTDANTYTGTFVVTNGTLELAKPAGTKAVGAVEVGGGLFPSILRLINADQISNTSDVTLVQGVDVLFDLNGKNETINDLIVGVGGKVTTGAGDLTTTGAVTLTAGNINMGPDGRLVLQGPLTAAGSGNDKTVQILGGTIDANGGSRTVAVNGASTLLEVTAALANGTFVKDGAGHMRGIGNSANAVQINVSEGKLTVLGLIPNASVATVGGTLSGTGQVGAVNATSGFVLPDVQNTPLRTANVVGSLASKFQFKMVQFGQTTQLSTTGAVDLNGSQLIIEGPGNLPIGSSYTLIRNDGADAILDQFFLVPEGALVQSNGQTFRISYVGETGNDVVATVVVGSNTGLSASTGTIARAGQNITLTAVVTAAANASGTVKFMEGNTLLGEVAVGAGGVANLPANFAEGTHSITAIYSGDTDVLGSTSAVFNLSVVPELYAVGAGVGGAPIVTVRNADGSLRSTINAFPATVTGGVRTATADINGDGFPDVIVGTGPGVPTLVKVFDGKTGSEIFAVAPFEASFTGGVYVAAGDMNGDGKAEFAITPDEGGGPRVRLFDGATFTPLADYFGIDDAKFRGGARAAFADLNGDDAQDLLLSAGFGGGPRVAGFDGAALAKGDTSKKLFNDFFAFEEGLRNGAFLSGGDLDGDGFAELVAGGGPGGGPRVTAFDGADLLTNKQTVVANFFAGDPNNRGGVPVGVKQLTSDDAADILAGAGATGGAKVTAYNGESVLKGNTDPLHQFDAFPGFLGGVFVG